MNEGEPYELDVLSPSFVFASDNSSATIGIVVFVAEGLGFVVQL
jgi:hypothetical protein